MTANISSFHHGLEASKPTGYHPQGVHNSGNRIFQIRRQHVGPTTSESPHDSQVAQNLIPTRSIPFRRLSYGEEIWTDGIGDSGFSTGKLFGEVAFLAFVPVLCAELIWFAQNPNTSTKYVSTSMAVYVVSQGGQ